MGEKRLVTVFGKTKSITAWARELGISKQWVSALVSAGRLESWILGERLVRGRPSKSHLICEALKEPRTAKEVCEIAGCSYATFCRYVKDNNVKKRNGRYVEFD